MTDFFEALPDCFSVTTLVILGMMLITLTALGRTLWMTRRFAEQTRLAQQNMLVSAVADVQEAAIVVDVRGVIDFLNPAAEKMLKFKTRSARGRSYGELFTLLEPLTHNVLGWLEAARNNDRPLLHHALLNTSGLKDVKVTYTVQAIEYEGVRQPFYLLLLRDQTELYAMQVSLEHVREHDPHTMLLNRKGFEVRLKHALDQVERHGVKHVFCLVAMDQFKLVNDTMGHSGGDVLIERIVKILKEFLNPATNILARLGGDEFGILFRGVEPKIAIRIVEQIRSRLENYDFEWSKKHLKITASIAFVPLFKSEDTTKRGRLTVAKVLSVADAACRVAKSKGGNRIHLYKANDQDILRQYGNLAWLEKLKKAFESSNFRLLAQPIHDLHPSEFTKPFSHYEVLVRLYDENNQPI
ncbi:MAG: diguanylate cyclase domain-containing protein, partial [Thiothrix sp.]